MRTPAEGTWMSGATAETYEWLHREFTDDAGDTWLLACFVRGLSPKDALRRIGITPGPPGESGFGVAAFGAGGGTVLIEVGWAGIVHDQAGPLSVGTVAASVVVTASREAFGYRVDGQAVTAFDLFSYPRRTGSDPDRLQPEVAALGMDVDGDLPGFPDDIVVRALALAERATGVHLSPGQYARSAVMGPVDHLDPYR